MTPDLAPLLVHAVAALWLAGLWLAYRRERRDAFIRARLGI